MGVSSPHVPQMAPNGLRLALSQSDNLADEGQRSMDSRVLPVSASDMRRGFVDCGRDGGEAMRVHVMRTGSGVSVLQLA